MPEFPDITIYLEALEQRILHQPLQNIRIASPFLVRTAVPPIDRARGQQVVALRRLGKRIAIGMENELWLVLHLMIAGRLHWRESSATPARKASLAAFDFPNGTLLLTEAGTKKRASLHVVEGEDGLNQLDPRGLEVLSASLDSFAKALTNRNHTLKRALTDPTLLSGIGNAYSDEILHRAGLSPVLMTQKARPEQIQRLFESAQNVLREWVVRLREEAAGAFPENVTAFRPGMAVHGRFGKPCPVCGGIIQRIRYAENETNYCPTCQTAGKLLADRSLSLLLKKDWPKTPDALEEMRVVHRRL